MWLLIRVGLIHVRKKVPGNSFPHSVTIIISSNPDLPARNIISIIPIFRSANITVTSQWARWRLYSPASRLLTEPIVQAQITENDQAQIAENIKVPRHWRLWGKFAGDRWIPLTKASNPISFPVYDVIMMTSATTMLATLCRFPHSSRFSQKGCAMQSSYVFLV